MRNKPVFVILFLAAALLLSASAIAADKGNMSYQRDGKDYSFYWGSDLFQAESQRYNNDLAVASAVLSWGVESSEKQPILKLFSAYQLKDLFMGCYDGGESYKTWQEKDHDFEDGVFAIGHGILSVDSPDDTTLLVVVGRGTMTIGEMRTDYSNTGNGSKFVAGKRVKQNISTYQHGMWQALEDYLRVHPITTSKVKMLITGHSLGGAMANLLSGRIIHDFDQIPWLKGKASKEDIYTYTFGAIRVLDQEKNISDGYENIHNVYNSFDSFGPDGNKGNLGVSSPNAKFGHTELYSLQYETIEEILKNPLQTRNHDMDNYLDALTQGCVRCESSVVDPVMPRYLSIPKEVEILRYAQKIYDEITEEFNADSYQTQINHELRGYTEKLNNAKQFSAIYNFHTNIASTLISLEMGLLMEDPKQIASAAASAGLDTLISDVMNIDIDLTLEDFVFSQATLAAKSLSRWDLYDTMKRAQENGGRFVSYEDAKLFLRRYLENRMNISTLGMAAGYYEHLMNRNAFQTFGDLFTRVAVSNLGGKLGGSFISSYVAGKLSTTVYSFLDIIGQQVNEKYVSSWISTQKQLVGEIEGYFSQKVFGLDLNPDKKPKRLSGYVGNWASDSEEAPSLTIGKSGDQYFVSLYRRAQDRTDHYVFGGVTSAGRIRFLNTENASVVSLELLESSLSVEIDTYEKDHEEHSRYLYHWQEYAWVGHWVNTENPETVLDITSNGDGTLHLAAHFAPDLSFGFDFPPVDYELLYFDTLEDPFPADMRIDGNTGMLEFRLFEQTELNFGWLTPNSKLFEHINQYVGSYYFTTENPPDLTRFGWVPHFEPALLTEEEALALFSGISGTRLQASSGAGAWEGLLKINADGSFIGEYHDSDADVMYQVSFSGRFDISETEKWGETVYRLRADGLTTANVPGTEGLDEYGDRIIYDEPLFHSGDYLFLTLPGTPDEEIPEMVRGEIGGTLGDWEVDYSRFITLTRAEDGWGFFADPADPPAYNPDPGQGEDAISVDWTGVWAGRNNPNNRLYVYRQASTAGEDCQTIQTVERDGRSFAFRGGLYSVDEITVDYYSEGILHAGIVQDPVGHTLSLTVFSSLDDSMLPWINYLTDDYEYIGPLDDPDSQIPSSLREITRTGMNEIGGAAPAEQPATVPAEQPAAAPEQSAWAGYWKTRDDSLAEMIVTDNGNGTLHAKVMFLPAGDFEATLTPQADGSMRFEDRYSHLIGQMTPQPDGGLYLTLTGGAIMEDEEATEYQGYYARGFAFYPTVYEEMWVQTPEEAASTEEDWLGIWTGMDASTDSQLNIFRENGALRVEVTLGQHHFSGLADMASDTDIVLYDDHFWCMLLLNRKLNRIAMMEIGSDMDSVYDWMSESTCYGVAIYQKAPDVIFQIPENNMPPMEQAPVTVSIPPAPAMTVSLLPIPGKPGYMQVPVAQTDATSYLSGKDPAAYMPFRMTDGEETTAFQFSTKTTKPGDEYLYFDFTAPVALDELWIKNGFWKVTDGKDQYTRNSRVEKMTVFIRYAGSGDYQEFGTVALADDKARRDWQVISLQNIRDVTGIRIRIDSIYKGSKFPNDVCISEIMFVQATGE